MTGTRKILIAFFLGFLAFSFVGCGNWDIAGSGNQEQLSSPPKLTVSFQAKSFEAIIGTYSWTVDNHDGTKTTTIADSSSPDYLVKDSTPISVPSKAALTLSFSNKPSSISVDIWRDGKIIKQEINDGKIIVPESKGLVVYGVDAAWEQGKVNYAFLVEVN